MIALRPIEDKDQNVVLDIFAQGIATGHATFETEPPSWDGWKAAHIDSCCIAALEEDRIVGWAALSPMSSRCVYGGVAETSVYVDPEHAGQGVGRLLLTSLIDASEKQDIWSLAAMIFPENQASVKLHELCGFRLIGTRERLGKMSYGPMEGQWRDVLLLERRSLRIGRD